MLRIGSRQLGHSTAFFPRANMATTDAGGEVAVVNLQHHGRAYHQRHVLGLSGLQTSYGEPLVQAWLTEPIESVVARFGPETAMLTAMLSAVEALALPCLELAPVRVNGVTPGLIDTPLLYTADGAKRDTLVQNRAAMLPGKRVGTADEVAQVILMLMTNDYVTGEVAHVDRGGRFVSHARSIPYTIDGHTLSLLLQATYAQQPCRPPEVTFHWPGTQEPTTVHPNEGDRYTIVRGDTGAFRVEQG